MMNLHLRQVRMAGVLAMACMLTVSVSAKAQATPASAPPPITNNPDMAKTAQTKSGSPPVQFALPVQQMGTETDKDGTFPVYKIVPPHAGWAIKSLNANQATVVLTPPGLEVSWVAANYDKTGKAMGRQKTVDVIPFDIVSTTVTYTPEGTKWTDARGHVFFLNRPISLEHEVEIGF